MGGQLFDAWPVIGIQGIRTAAERFPANSSNDRIFAILRACPNAVNELLPTKQTEMQATRLISVANPLTSLNDTRQARPNNCTPLQRATEEIEKEEK